MKTIIIHQYDAFSKEPNKGNPAGVVLNGEELNSEEMQEIACGAGFNETAFPIKSDIADFKIRFFTPGHETDLCGHATMATVYALATKGLLNGKEEFTIETGAGVLPIKIDSTSENDIQITMRQAPPQFEPFNGSTEELAESIGLRAEDIDNNLPILYGSTGAWTLIVPIKKLDTFKRMKPFNEKFPAVLKEMPNTSVHPFCMETYDPAAQMHGRHFSSPYSGTTEDAVTGTASGVMGAYFATYIKNNDFTESLHLTVEQGHETGKNGRVFVHVSKNDGQLAIEITGTAVRVKEFEWQLQKK